MSSNTQEISNAIIRTTVRSIYDLQKMRIQMGNRITGNFKDKLGQSPLPGKVMSEKELEKEEKKILEQLRLSYKRITDGVVARSKSDNIPEEGKLPTLKKFVGDGLITTYAELALVDQYIGMLREEEKHFARLENVLTGIPIYDKFLSGVHGIGPALAGVIISEIDITKAEYPSSLHAYAGLDALKVGVYKNAAGNECIVPESMLEVRHENGSAIYYAEGGKYVAHVEGVGRSRQKYCLVEREYTNREGEMATKVGITFNPFLKTKLMGVMGTSFLRTGTATVDGKVMGGAKRLAFALSEGMSPDIDQDDENVQAFLRLKGHSVVVEPNEYAKPYYEYKARLQNDPRHADKTDLHRHNMALRYMVKQFLNRLYVEWKTVSGLPIAAPYHEAKLGMVHGSANKYLKAA